jgi:hypothetical protein
MRARRRRRRGFGTAEAMGRRDREHAGYYSSPLDRPATLAVFQALRLFRLISSVSSRCCKSRSWDVVYVAMTIYACCNLIFQVFLVVFRRMFQMFHSDVVKVYLDVA